VVSIENQKPNCWLSDDFCWDAGPVERNLGGGKRGQLASQMQAKTHHQKNEEDKRGERRRKKASQPNVRVRKKKNKSEKRINFWEGGKI